jgi:folate-binding protein YgfZ
MHGEVVSKLLAGALEIDGRGSEYRALVDACALAARVDRATVTVAGERPAEMLNGLVTQKVVGLAGSGRHALLLTPKGRVLTDLRVFPRADELQLDVPATGLPNLLGAFQKYLPPIYARYEDVSDRLRQLGVYGPAAAEAARTVLGADVPTEHLGVRELESAGAPVLVVRSRRLAGDGVEFILPGDAAAPLAEALLSEVTALGGRAVGARALEVVRVESGVPLYGVDMDESNLAQETGLESEAISYDKGCYLGQEVVARIHFRGHVNRRLMGLKFADRPAPRGAALYDGEKEVGAVTSSVVSPDLGAIGLGYVRREFERADRLRWADGAHAGAATLAELPFRAASV